jgi:serine/threonine protein kinase
MRERKGDERFVFEKPLDSGGQGEVWLAEDRLFTGKVAVKILESGTTSDEECLRELLWAEAHLHATVCPMQQPHPNIAYILHIARFDGELGIVMEYVPGKSVAQLMGKGANRKPLPAPRMIDIVLQICHGLEAAHAKGVIHRDIKPKNIMVRDADQLVKIIDWGIAKNIDIAGRGWTYAGTPPYMSPEVVELNKIRDRGERRRGAGVDHRTDIYSLGVTMFEMLTTHTPFGTDGERILRGVAPEQENRLVESGVDVTLARIVLKAMALHPRDRHQTAAELKSALEAWGRKLTPGDLEEAWNLYTQRKDPEAAEKKFKEILARNDADPEAYLGLAQFYIQCSREDDAIQILNLGIGRPLASAPLFNTRGRLYGKRNSPAALGDLERALSLGLSAREERQVRFMLQNLRKTLGPAPSSGEDPADGRKEG